MTPQAMWAVTMARYMAALLGGAASLRIARHGAEVPVGTRKG
jgi:hypothetical protein